MVKKNFALRYINFQVGEPYSESELQVTEQQIKIIQDNQKYYRTY